MAKTSLKDTLDATDRALAQLEKLQAQGKLGRTGEIEAREQFKKDYNLLHEKRQSDLLERQETIQELRGKISEITEAKNGQIEDVRKSLNEVVVRKDEQIAQLKQAIKDVAKRKEERVRQLADFQQTVVSRERYKTLAAEFSALKNDHATLREKAAWAIRQIDGLYGEIDAGETNNG